MQKLVAVCVAFVLVFSGCAPRGDVDKLEKRVETLEGLVKSLIELEGMQIQKAQVPPTIGADDITTPTLCRGKPVVWDQFGSGLTC